MLYLRTMVSGASTIPVDVDGRPFRVSFASVKCVHNWVDNFYTFPSFPVCNAFYGGYCRLRFYQYYNRFTYGSYYPHWVLVDVSLKIISGAWKWEGFFEMHTDPRPFYYGPFSGYTVRQALSRDVTDASDLNAVGPFTLGAFIQNDLPDPEQTAMVFGDSVAIALV